MICKAGWTFAEYRRVVNGHLCPSCGADVVGLLRTQNEAADQAAGSFRSGFAFFLVALNGCIALTLFWFGSDLIEALLVSTAGYRPIAGAFTAVRAASFASVVVYLALSFPFLFLFMRRVPGLIST